MNEKFKENNIEYWNENLFYQICSRFYHRHKNQRIIITMELHDHFNSHWTPGGIELRKYAALDRTDTWTTMSPEALHQAGFKKVTGLYDSLIWWKVPVYLQIHGAKKFNIKERNEAGALIYSQDSAATLHDFMQSKATQNFIKGMGRTAVSSMDMQKIGMIAIIGAGAIFGMYMLGVI